MLDSFQIVASHGGFMTTIRRARLPVCLALSAVLLAEAAFAAATCPEEQSTPQLPTDLQLCAELEADVRAPSKFRLDIYEGKLNQYLFAMCHRNTKSGWVRDKRIRDAGPWIGTFSGGKWSGKYFGTHVPVLIWYSPEMHEWLKANRPTPEFGRHQPGSGRRHDDQGDVFDAGCRLRGRRHR